MGTSKREQLPPDLVRGRSPVSGVAPARGGRRIPQALGRGHPAGQRTWVSRTAACSASITTA